MNPPQSTTPKPRDPIRTLCLVAVGLQSLAAHLMILLHLTTKP